MPAVSPIRFAAVWVEVRAVQVPATVGYVRLNHHCPVYPAISKVALVDVIEVAVRVLAPVAGVVNHSLATSAASAQPAAEYALKV